MLAYKTKFLSIELCLKILLLAIFSVRYSDKNSDEPPFNKITCKVEDKAKLEDIELFPSENPRNLDISGYSATNQVILTAMKHYGLILADIGSDLYITGTPDDRWDNEDLNQLKSVKATDFEIVQMGEIISN